jgi:predicted kinase
MVGTLVEFGGLPGTGKSTLARRLGERMGAVVLRVDEIEAAMRRSGLTADGTGIAAYGVAHAVAGPHLRRGFTVVVDAVNPVREAREGWRALAEECGARHVVIETRCAEDVHRVRVETRPDDVPGWVYPDWDGVLARKEEYEVRTDERLVVDTTRPVRECHDLVARYVG